MDDEPSMSEHDRFRRRRPRAPPPSLRGRRVPQGATGATQHRHRSFCSREKRGGAQPAVALVAEGGGAGRRGRLVGSKWGFCVT
jgi:hypothetical protein